MISARLASLAQVQRTFNQRMADLTPPDDEAGRAGRLRAYVEGMGVLWLFHLNGRLIEKVCRQLPDRWGPSRLDWASDLEAEWSAIRQEVDAYLAAGTMPHTSEVSGLDPDSEEAKASVPADRGAWRTVVLQFFGEWIEENCAHFPRTVEALSRIDGVTSIGFTALDPRSHIGTHVGPNRGALRFQLPIITPGPPGACRIRVGEEMIEWHEGESVLFDLSVEHEAWNDSDSVRVLLMIEVPTPLPPGMGALNRLVQRSYRLFPSYRRLPGRARQLAVERSRALRDGDAPERWRPATSSGLDRLGTIGQGTQGGS